MTVTDLAAERRTRRPPPDVTPSADERDARALALGEGAAGRVRVLRRHPGLAEAVRAAYKLADIGQWSGYLPPRECGGSYNDSPLRRTVVTALAEAWRREQSARARQET